MELLQSCTKPMKYCEKQLSSGTKNIIDHIDTLKPITKFLNIGMSLLAQSVEILMLYDW